MSGKTDILVVGKEVVVLCAEGSRAVILRKTRRVNGIIALELALSAPSPKKKLPKGSTASRA